MEEVRQVVHLGCRSSGSCQFRESRLGNRLGIRLGEAEEVIFFSNSLYLLTVFPAVFVKQIFEGLS